MRNPWGTETYHDDYSDESELWTDSLRQQAGSVVANDGEFFMPIEKFHSQVGYTQINRNVDNISRAHHLTIGDERNNGTGKNFCLHCTRHVYAIKSETDQTLNVMVGTWDARGTPSSCKSQFETKHGAPTAYHYAWFNGGEYGRSRSANYWKQGDGRVGERAVKAKQTYFLTVEMDWTDEEISPDFSVVVHGLGGGKVMILRQDRKESDQLPDILSNGSPNKNDNSNEEGAAENSEGNSNE